MPTSWKVCLVQRQGKEKIKRRLHWLPCTFSEEKHVLQKWLMGEHPMNLPFKPYLCKIQLERHSLWLGWQAIIFDSQSYSLFLTAPVLMHLLLGSNCFLVEIMQHRESFCFWQKGSSELCGKHPDGFIGIHSWRQDLGFQLQSHVNFQGSPKLQESVSSWKKKDGF